MPSVHNRVDPETEVLTKTVDLHEVLATLESTLEETLEAAGPTEEASRLATEQMDAAASETQGEIERAKQKSDLTAGDRGGS